MNHMVLKTQEFVEKKLVKANYRFDESVGQWIGWIKGFPGVYAQGKTIEDVRNELAEVLEEYLFVGAMEKRKIPGFNLNLKLAC